jgi:RNase H-like domain found in reverse transcriptase
MWICRSEVLAPLSKLTSKMAKWQWTAVEQKAFETMKCIILRETLLAYPDFQKPFIIHTDASHTQLGAVISQDNRPIAFYSRKLNPAQTRYTTTERELLSIVETLKEFWNILLGQRIKVYTDHQNLTYTNFNTERVMGWRLIIEEFSPELIYLKVERNIVADTLSRLALQNSDVPSTKMHDLHYLAKHFALEDDDLPDDAFPVHYKLIAQHQNKQKDLFIKLKNQDGYHLKSFCGGGKKRTLNCCKEKIVIPMMLQRHVVTMTYCVTLGRQEQNKP